mmetsp:Transcript_102041/g.304485  ORF Transcript_102041/g.304485 Transcript_102041/m.304485 type:complete len:232 (-) Transcript_102041:1893-2588(-)
MPSLSAIQTSTIAPASGASVPSAVHTSKRKARASTSSASAKSFSPSCRTGGWALRKGPSGQDGVARPPPPLAEALVSSPMSVEAPCSSEMSANSSWPQLSRGKWRNPWRKQIRLWYSSSDGRSSLTSAWSVRTATASTCPARSSLQPCTARRTAAVMPSFVSTAPAATSAAGSQPSSASRNRFSAGAVEAASSTLGRSTNVYFTSGVFPSGPGLEVTTSGVDTPQAGSRQR